MREEDKYEMSKVRNGELIVAKKDGKGVAKCGKCGSVFSAEEIRNMTSGKSPLKQKQNTRSAIPEKKKAGCIRRIEYIISKES